MTAFQFHNYGAIPTEDPDIGEVEVEDTDTDLDSDVEAQLSRSVASASASAPKNEEYEDITDPKQLEVLGMLDACIHGSHGSVKVPLLATPETGEIYQIILANLIEPAAIATASMMLLATLSLLNAIPALVFTSFHYGSLFAIFAVSANHLSNRIMTNARSILKLTTKLQEKIAGALNSKLMAVVDSIYDKTHSLIASIRPTLDKATEIEKLLQKFDPDIDIPDPTDIEREFDSAKAKIKESGLESLERALPNALTERDVAIRLILPVLAVNLIIQLITLHVTRSFSAPSNHSDVSVRRLLADSMSMSYVLLPIFVPFVTAAIQHAFIEYVTIKAKPWAMERARSEATGRAKAVIEERGISTNVLGDQMVRIRAKVLKVLKHYNVVIDITNRPEVRMALQTAGSIKSMDDVKKLLGEFPKDPEALEDMAAKMGVEPQQLAMGMAAKMGFDAGGKMNEAKEQADAAKQQAEEAKAAAEAKVAAAKAEAGAKAAEMKRLAEEKAEEARKQMEAAQAQIEGARQQAEAQAAAAKAQAESKAAELKKIAEEKAAEVKRKAEEAKAKAKAKAEEMKRKAEEMKNMASGFMSRFG